MMFDVTAIAETDTSVPGGASPARVRQKCCLFSHRASHQAPVLYHFTPLFRFMLLFSFLCLYLLSILSLGRNTLTSLTTAHKFLEEVFLEEVAVLRHSLRGFRGL